MYIVINFSNKIDGFNLFTNCFYPLYKNQSLSYIDFNKKLQNEKIDFEDLKKDIESELASASTSRYSLIILYDYKLQERNPLIYSTTGIINNIKSQICESISYSYRLEDIYFVTLDDAERDSDGLIINTTLKQNIEFDRKGYVDEESEDYYFTKSDLDNIKEGFKDIARNYLINQKNKTTKKPMTEFDNKYLKPVETRIMLAHNRLADKNCDWYFDKMSEVFVGYRKEIERFMEDMLKRDKGLEDLRFSIADYILVSISSCNGKQQEKCFRLNMHDDKGRVSKSEAKYRSYYKIIAFIICIVVQDKKYLFGNALTTENHYVIDINILDDVIENMLVDYRNNLSYELEKIGEIKFNGIYVETFEKTYIETAGGPAKRFDFTAPKFSLIKNDTNLKDTETYAENWKERYTEHVNYVNHRLRGVTNKLRVSMLREFNGEKKEVSANELQSIIDDKENDIKILKEKISANTPNDSIPIDFKIFEKNDKSVQEANKILNGRITLLHFMFNVSIVLFASMIMWPAFRRFQKDILLFLFKFLIFLIPAITYILVQLVFCLIQVHKANRYMVEIEEHTRKKIEDINVDDDKFKQYVNDIYELMLLTKYVGKLKENANVANIEVDNYKYHREVLNEKLNEVEKISRLLRVDISKKGNKLKNIPVDLSVNKYENDAYCPVLYADNNGENYILVNNEQNVSISDNMLNFVSTIKFNYDEVYNERY